MIYIIKPFRMVAIYILLTFCSCLGVVLIQFLLQLVWPNGVCVKFLLHMCGVVYVSASEYHTSML
jgi:hypothetical protein